MKRELAAQSDPDRYFFRIFRAALQHWMTEPAEHRFTETWSKFSARVTQALDQTPLDAFNKTLEVNIRGYFYMTNFVGRHMKQVKSGSIINIASVNGVIPGDYQSVYSITKSAVIAMTKAHAKEWARKGIRVNCLLPGLTKTKFAKAITDNPEMMKQVLPHIPMGRAAEPEEMTGHVLYSASDASRYTTGSVVNVDGGYLLV